MTDHDVRRPPRLAELLLRLALPDTPARATILGDLRQEFDEVTRGERGLRLWRRRAWFWREAIALAAHYAWRPARPRRRTSERTRRRRDPLMRDFLSDFRYGWRSLVRRPGFSLVIVVTIALAIGANNLVFSFANLLLIRPLPVADPATLVWVYSVDPQRSNDRGSVSMADFLDWRATSVTLEHLAATARTTHTLTGAGEPLRLVGSRATASLFDAWGLQPALGRRFLPGEDRPGAQPVAMLSHGYWTRHDGANPGVLGRTLTLDGVTHTIVGVMPKSLELGNLSLIDVWTPLPLEPGPRDARNVTVTGRRKPGVTLEQAVAELDGIGRQIATRHPATNGGWTTRVLSFRDAIVGRGTWVILALLFVVTGLVLIIACANVGNLMLARATVRSRELAVRFALGASRFRVARQMVGESLVLGLLGGGGGLLVVWLALEAIRSIDAEPFFQQVGIDTNMLMFVLLLSTAATLLFTAAPALYANRGDLRRALTDGGRGATGGRWAQRGRSALVVCQLALAVSLVFVAGLSVRSAIALRSMDPGYLADGVLMARVDLDRRRHATPEAPQQFVDALSARLRAAGEIGSFAVVDRVPTLDGESAARFTIEGRPEPTPSAAPWAGRFTVSDTYLSTLGIALDRGRFFAPTDTAEAPPVAVVNREAARRYWPGHSPIGSRIRLSATMPWIEVVGVVANVRPSDVDASAMPQLYVPLAQHATLGLSLLVRVTGRPPAAASVSLRAAVHALDPALALYDLEPLAGAIAREQASTHIVTGMFVGFGLVALMLAATGLFGVMSFTVAQRRAEFGTRMALGASRTDITALVLGSALRLLAAGSVLGVAGGFLLGKTLERTLHGVTASDARSLCATVATLVLVGLVATLGPLRRATRVDPIVALRAD